MEPSAALLTDLYELTMAAAYVAEGLAEKPATFSLFVRQLPPERGYLVAAGLDSVLSHLETLRFTEADVSYLDGLGLFEPPALERLAALRFTGSVRAVPEGRIVFAGEPLVEVTAPMIEAQIVETFLLNQITTECTLATKAARYRHAAADRPVIDFGFRRAQGIDAAMKVARAVAICGLAGTSNVAAGMRYGVPLSGTMAHSFVQAHGDEADAFRVFARLFGERTVMLVDTYDSARGIERALEVARELAGGGIEPRAIRLDSGDLSVLARLARRRFDEEGFPRVQVFASGGLDEHIIASLVADGVPIDGFGVGSDLAVSADVPVLDTAYKLVAFDGRAVRKRSEGKETWPGAKQVWRDADWSGDVLALEGEPTPGSDAEPLLVEVMGDGVRTSAGHSSLTDANQRFEVDWSALPAAAKHLREAVPIEVRVSEGLRVLTAEVDAAEAGTDEKSRR